MSEVEKFDLEQFLPYMINQAAEATSRDFHAIYSGAYGLRRTQWRVMAHLGKYGALTASEICRLSHTEKTKVSRAVLALEGRGYLVRQPSQQDRRRENLSLTEAGAAVYADLAGQALAYDRALRAALGAELGAALDCLMLRLSELGGQAQEVLD